MKGEVITTHSGKGGNNALLTIKRVTMSTVVNFLKKLNICFSINFEKGDSLFFVNVVMFFGKNVDTEKTRKLDKKNDIVFKTIKEIQKL